jgi:hypothetical protein
VREATTKKQKLEKDDVIRHSRRALGISPALGENLLYSLPKRKREFLSRASDDDENAGEEFVDDFNDDNRRDNSKRSRSSFSTTSSLTFSSSTGRTAVTPLASTTARTTPTTIGKEEATSTIETASSLQENATALRIAQLATQVETMTAQMGSLAAVLATILGKQNVELKLIDASIHRDLTSYIYGSILLFFREEFARYSSWSCRYH